MSLVEVDSIYRAFGNVQAVNGLSFSIDQGQIVGFIGANGAGKTTTMRMMVTLEVPDSGAIRICDMDVLDHPREVRKLIGWMPDHFGGYPNMDVLEYLDFYARAFGLKGKERRRQLDDILAFTDLDVLAERPCDRLSKGQTQRLCLGRALLSDPEILVLDEPAAGLDPKARIEFKNLVRLLADRGKTLFISSHILSELGEMCNHLLFIDQGRQVHQGTADSLKYHKAEGGLTVRMRCNGDGLRFDQWLAGQTHIKATKKDDDMLEIHITHDDNKDSCLVLAETIRSLVEAKVEVFEFHRIERRLEDAFVDILGDLN
ncbi:ABC transporter ATP-binding protein [Rubellicoccus peritrichatus]|uniref:ABC transporter ATP-binding protein n=1 Tax=Rubellicoccus peritrichatus TaxID=3080537 RepID=A0AAQ3QQ13_9BACT|nr:ABC transporter ATP-binding protein [Puniceicoccus sp. CR14]WOO39713.1 ABC transporter ATP-binding protein [Puniceicoccus sp. CR14]